MVKLLDVEWAFDVYFDTIIIVPWRWTCMPRTYSLHAAEAPIAYGVFLLIPAGTMQISRATALHLLFEPFRMES